MNSHSEPSTPSEKTDNELIAEFMGAIESRDSGICGIRMYWINNNDPVPTETREMQYHTSWDWLMPVVDKIQFFAHVEIANGQCLISVNGEMVSSVVNGSNLENVYMAVVRYIKWYNNEAQHSTVEQGKV